MNLKNEQDVIDLIRKDQWMMNTLHAVQTLDLPDWWICAGFVRSKIWDTLHHFEERTAMPDIDMIYFDLKNKQETEEKRLESLLCSSMPNIPWSVKNEARMHLRNNVNPYLDAEDAIAKFPETVTALGIRLDNNEQLQLTAPHGVKDVLQMTVHPTPLFAKSETLMEIYHTRMRTKNWSRHWRLVRYDR